MPFGHKLKASAIEQYWLVNQKMWGTKYSDKYFQFKCLENFPGAYLVLYIVLKMFSNSFLF